MSVRRMEERYAQRTQEEINNAHRTQEEMNNADLLEIRGQEKYCYRTEASKNKFLDINTIMFFIFQNLIKNLFQYQRN